MKPLVPLDKGAGLEKDGFFPLGAETKELVNAVYFGVKK